MARTARYYKDKLWEMKYSESNNSYYTMYPVEKPKKGQRRTQRKWLRGDEEQAIIKFNLFFDDLEGKQNTYVNTQGEVYIPSMGSIDLETGKYPKQMIQLPIDEKHYFSWLREKIINKEFDYLAQGTGYHGLVKLPNILNAKDEIPLTDRKSVV